MKNVKIDCRFFFTTVAQKETLTSLVLPSFSDQLNNIQFSIFNFQIGNRKLKYKLQFPIFN